jgi:hypothetical protein
MRSLPIHLRWPRYSIPFRMNSFSLFTINLSPLAYWRTYSVGVRVGVRVDVGVGVCGSGEKRRNYI